jgi:hypothetical protein
MVLTCFTLLMPASSLVSSPQYLSILLRPTYNAPLPFSSLASVYSLAPLRYPRSRVRPVSYYALFKGWLLLSQPPGCLNTTTSFPTELYLRDLSRGSGLFPSRRRNSSHAVDCRALSIGILSLNGVGKLAPPSPVSALPPMLNTRRSP